MPRMVTDMQTQLYFWEPLMKRHKQELSLVELYFTKTKVQFENIEIEFDRYAEKTLSAFSNYEDTDFFTAAEWAAEKGVEMYEMLSIMKLNHLLMTISMLYHIWEQQLVRFTMQELRNDLDLGEKKLSYEHVQKIFEVHEIDICSTESWMVIKELKALTNTIKHGDGDSAKKLKKIRPDFFKLSFIDDVDSLELAGSPLLDQYSLQVKEEDLYNYIKSTKAFWGEMPERAFANIDDVISVLNGRK